MAQVNGLAPCGTESPRLDIGLRKFGVSAKNDHGLHQGFRLKPIFFGLGGPIVVFASARSNDQLVHGVSLRRGDKHGTPPA
jgi:hypothetical protein